MFSLSGYHRFMFSMLFVNITALVLLGQLGLGQNAGEKMQEQELKNDAYDQSNFESLSSYEFQSRDGADYFTTRIPQWKYLFGHVMLQDYPWNILEVGSFEGRSTVWMLQNIVKNNESRITCIDTWESGEEFSEDQMEGRYELFLRNTEPWRSKIDIMRGKSSKMLRDPKISTQMFDIIYIDGGHQARTVLEDAILAFYLLNPNNGVMVFDDYLGGVNPYALSMDLPKAGIDAFLKFYAGYYKVVYSGYQLFLQKTANVD